MQLATRDADRSWVDRFHARLTVAENTFLLGNFASAFSQADAILGQYLLLCPGQNKTLDTDVRPLPPGDPAYACLVLAAESLHEQGLASQLDAFLRKYFTSLSKMPLELYQLWATVHSVAGNSAHVAETTEKLIRAVQHRLQPDAYQAYIEILLFRGLVPLGRFADARDLAGLNKKLSPEARALLSQHVEAAAAAADAKASAAAAAAAAAATAANANASVTGTGTGSHDSLIGPALPSGAHTQLHQATATSSLTSSSSASANAGGSDKPSQQQQQSTVTTAGSGSSSDKQWYVEAPFSDAAAHAAWLGTYTPHPDHPAYLQSKLGRLALLCLRLSRRICAVYHALIATVTDSAQRPQLIAALHTLLRLFVAAYILYITYTRFLRAPLQRALLTVTSLPWLRDGATALANAAKMAFSFGVGSG